MYKLIKKKQQFSHLEGSKKKFNSNFIKEPANRTHMSNIINIYFDQFALLLRFH